MRTPAFLKTKKAKILLGILALLIILRIALPYILLHYANRSLANMNGYYGHIQDIDVALYRGAYMIDSFYLHKLDSVSQKQTPFMSARDIDLSLEWKALFQGRLVGELVFEQPSLVFTENKVELADVSKDTSDFRELLRNFMPVDVNRCELRNGKLAYIDRTRKPNVDVAITQLNATALNLKNVYKSSDILPATIEANGTVYKGAMTIQVVRLSTALIPIQHSCTARMVSHVGLNYCLHQTTGNCGIRRITSAVHDLQHGICYDGLRAAANSVFATNNWLWAYMSELIHLHRSGSKISKLICSSPIKIWITFVPIVSKFKIVRV